LNCVFWFAVSRSNRFVILSSLLVGVSLSLASCANSNLGDTIQRSLAADPQLEENAVPSNGPDQNSDNQANAIAKLPADFPTEIPRYPDAELIEPISAPPSSPSTATSDAGNPASNSSNPEQQTRWTTADTATEVEQFYRSQFQDNGWQLVQEPESNTPNRAEQPIVAEREGLQVTVTIPARNESPSTNPRQNATSTEFIITYKRNLVPSSRQANSSQSGDPQAELEARSPSPSPSSTAQASSSSGLSQTFTDINQVPPELKQHIEDLAELGVLHLQPTNAETSSVNPTQFKPNEVIKRREYARWLVAANNRFYSDRPANKIRLGVSTSQPAFQDVPRTDPDFAAIQGLAEAGLIPSPLSGDSTTVTFRPDAPLTRENLLLWKAPIDTRQALPNASVQAVQETWGFQDAARIDPRALRAVLADFRNGDLSNIRRTFGFTTLFQPKKPVTRAEAAATLWYFGAQGEGISASELGNRE
jgi:S-layer homology domain